MNNDSGSAQGTTQIISVRCSTSHFCHGVRDQRVDFERAAPAYFKVIEWPAGSYQYSLKLAVATTTLKYVHDLVPGWQTT